MLRLKANKTSLYKLVAGFTPLPGMSVISTPGGFFTPSPLRCAAGSSKRVFKAWRYEHERNKRSQG